MSFSSGAYFGNHSTVSQGRAAKAACEALLVWMGPLSRTRTKFVLHNCPVDRVEATQEVDEVAAALGRAGTDDQLARGEIEGTDHCSFAGLPRRLDPQVASPLGPRRAR